VAGPRLLSLGDYHEEILFGIFQDSSNLAEFDRIVGWSAVSRITFPQRLLSGHT
jgi:hypothetical protein